MSHFLDRLTYFTRDQREFAGGHGVVTTEDRTWERAYRERWAHDKIVRSTHGTNCTGSCSWKIYVKGGVVTWETQQTDYPRTRPDMPNHEPRGCSRGASYSWYLYSANRLKYPMVRGRLIRLWREARKTLGPVEAWASIVEDPVKAKSYKSVRGLGGFVRSQWDEVNEIIAAANVYTIKKHGPDRVIGFSPIPAMSMVSYAAGQPLPVADRRRVHELLRLVLRPAAVLAADLGRADRRAGIRRLVQLDVHHGVGQQRAADPHARRAFLHRGPLQGREDRRGHARLRRGLEARRPVAAPEAGHRRRARDGDGPRDPEGIPPRAAVGLLPGLLPPIQRHADAGEARQARQPVRRRPLSARFRLRRQLGQTNNPEWKTVAVDETSGKVVAPQGSIGYRWGQKEGGDLGKWNLETKEGGQAPRRSCALSLIDAREASRPSRSRTSAASSTRVFATTTRAATSWCAASR